MYVVLTKFVVQLAGHGVGLADLLGLQAVALEHVVEVGVAADVELHGALELHAALPEQAGKLAMHDGRADLALDIVSDNRQSRLFEALLPERFASNKDRNTVDQ